MGTSGDRHPETAGQIGTEEKKVARRTFFSFHYERDAWRAGQVRNSWIGRDREAAGFWDAARWEEVRRKGQAAIHAWIDEQLKGTSVTVVLIGAETADRPYVNYEITESHQRGNGLLGIHIHNLKDNFQQTDYQGTDPFAKWKFRDPQGRTVTYPTYDWVWNDGRSNMGTWIEAAARRAGR
jgi:hypothetical protein